VGPQVARADKGSRVVATHGKGTGAWLGPSSGVWHPRPPLL